MFFFFFILQPKIQVASKYERRVDTRSYDDKKKLFEGVSMFMKSIHESKELYQDGIISLIEFNKIPHISLGNNPLLLVFIL